MNRLLSLLFGISGLLLLNACGNTPQKSEQNKAAVVNTSTTNKKRDESPQGYLTRAEQAKSVAMANIAYVRAADAYIKEKNYLNAYALLNQIDPTTLSAYMQQQHQLFLAEASFALGYKDASYPMSQSLAPFSQFEQRVWQVKADAATETLHYLPAVRAKLKLITFSDNESDIALYNQQIWHHINQLESLAIKNFQSSKEPQLQGWLTLLAITQQHAKQPSKMLTEIKRWQHAYPTHPAAKQLPASLLKALDAKEYKTARIAVILPLSGTFAKQGKAVQQGLLAGKLANISNVEQSVEFINSQQLSSLTIDPTQYDFIIGPLLKDNIETVNRLFRGVPQLNLNQQNTVDLHQDVYSFALTPESEAKQAAKRLTSEGYKAPAIIAANNNYGKRFAKEFASLFEETTNNKPHLVFYSKPNEMKSVVEQVLGTKESKTNIKTLKSLFGNKKSFNADARNKQDIDLVYIVGDATQTKMLKPYIDVNTAPFAKPSPIFATSRSYSANLTQADLNDLNGITFSQIPWLMPNAQQAHQLATEMDNLWPNNSNDQKRLFAFGYDAYYLIPHLAQMKAFSAFRLNGLSGQLEVNNSNQVERTLEWAEYKNNKVSKRDFIH